MPNTDSKILGWAHHQEWERICQYFEHLIDLKENLDNHKYQVLEEDEKGRRAIHWCCVGVAPLDVFKHILELGGKEALTKDVGGRVPLHLACNHKVPLNLIRLILDVSGFEDISIRDYEDNSPLDIAIMVGAPLDVICHLLEMNGEKITLFKAITQMDWGEVEHYLCDDSIDDHDKLNAVSCSDQQIYFPKMNSLHWSCKCNAPISVIQILLDYGVNPSKKDERGRTPFHLACYNRADIDVLHLLMEKGGEELMEEDDNGITPLISAFLLNLDDDFVKHLIERETKFKKFKVHLSHLYSCIVSKDWVDVEKFLKDETIPDIDKVTSICYKDIYSKSESQNRNSLHWACRYSAPKKIMHLLISLGGRHCAASLDKGERTPLHIACQRDASLDVIKALVLASRHLKIDIFDMQDKGDLTPLGNACVSEASKEVIDYLLERQGIKKSITGKLKDDKNLLDILYSKQAPFDIIDMIEEKLIEIDPHMEIVENSTIEGSVNFRLKYHGNFDYLRGKFIRTILNEYLIRKSSLSILMTDFYIQLTLVLVFSISSNSDKLSEWGKNLLIVCEIWIVLKEISKLVVTPFISYVTSFWNVVCFTQIILVGISITSFNLEKTCASGIVWFGFIGVLKNMNYRISNVVCLLIEVMKELIPFIIVMLLLLAACSQMFETFCRDKVDEICRHMYNPIAFPISIGMTLTDEWFDEVLYDCDEKVSITVFSVIFGFIFWILIINIIIAKINNVFQITERKGTSLFWRTRLASVAENKLIVIVLKHMRGNKTEENRSLRSGLNHLSMTNSIYTTKEDVSTDISKSKVSLNRRFNFSMSDSKLIKSLTTEGDRMAFFLWWMNPEINETPTLKTRLNFYFQREELCEIFLPGETFERILYGKNHSNYLLSHFISLLLLFPLLILFFSGLGTFGLLWPKLIKKALFFAPAEGSETISGEVILESTTTLDNKVTAVNENISEIQKLCKKIEMRAINNESIIRRKYYAVN